MRLNRTWCVLVGGCAIGAACGGDGGGPTEMADGGSQSGDAGADGRGAASGGPSAGSAPEAGSGAQAGAHAIGGESGLPGVGGNGDLGGAGERAGGAGGVDSGCDGSMVILLDRSASMSENLLPNGEIPWAVAQDAIVSVIDDLPEPRAWALKLFPDSGPNEIGCGPLSSTLDVPLASQSSDAVRASVLATQADGSGTPLAAAYVAARNYVAGLPGPKPPLVIITDGRPSCGLAGMVTSDAAQAELVQLVKDGAADGVRAYFVGIGTDSPVDYDALSELAEAGMTAKLANPIAPTFHASTSGAELTAALASIADQAASCRVANDIDPFHRELPFVDDFEPGTLAAFRVGSDTFPFDFTGDPATIRVEDQNHLLTIGTPAGEPMFVYGGGHEWGDTTLSVHVRLSTLDARASIRVHVDPWARSHISLELGGNVFRVRQRVNGSLTDLLNPPTKPMLALNVWHKITLAVSGDQVSASFNDVVQGSATLLDASTHGGISLGSLEGNVDFDDVAATP